MKSHIAIVLVAVFCAAFLNTEPVAAEPTLSVSVKNEVRFFRPGESFELMVKIDDATGVAGAEMTINYDADAFVVNEPDNGGYFVPRESDMFPDYRYGNHFSGSGPIRLSGAHINNEGGSAYSDQKTLFCFSLRIKDTVSDGDFTFSLAETDLVGAVNEDHSGWNDPATAFPRIASSGSSLEIRVRIDVDKDYLPDAWENQHFGSLEQGPGDDFDGDGDTNDSEWLAGKDPSNARSVVNHPPYSSFNVGVFRSSEQTLGNVFLPDFSGAQLHCQARENECFDKIAIDKSGIEVFSKDLPGCPTTATWTEYFDSVEDMLLDFVPNDFYTVDLTTQSSITGSGHLVFDFRPPYYDATLFPEYVTVEEPPPGTLDLPWAPEFDFATDSWNFLKVLKVDTGEEVYSHYHSGSDQPADTHQVLPESALPEDFPFWLVVVDKEWPLPDTDWFWLGSRTEVYYSTVLVHCLGDSEGDLDVDGSDLADFAVWYDQGDCRADLNGDGFINGLDFYKFCRVFARNDCPNFPADFDQDKDVDGSDLALFGVEERDVSLTDLAIHFGYILGNPRGCP